ncbi:hypothetical protein BDB00DRAFT_838954 [Zychaea mexicana]|uniref:uncharacterized protein n=1 Tax=Zychaea mexicana TaxID=64656 RepID=UPI0022FDDD05|nr:uncharacterized protein BDB00DRAFT_838954 [Zychaea mexicana]KAI9490249.1 hypothetical protein BDB00DRAFT_838954 [Zychaea mexicana]
MSSPSYTTLFDFAPRHTNFRTRPHASAILAFQQHHRAAAAAAGLSSRSGHIPRKRRTIKDELTAFAERHSHGPPQYPAYLKSSVYACMVQEQYTLYCTKQLSTPATATSSSSSSSDKQIPPDSLTAALISHDLRLPTAWNPDDKGEFVDISEDCLELTYKGAGKEDADISAVRANYPFRPQCGIFYYEVEIISKGLDGHIGIGFCWASNSLDRLPGWEEHSWGYHGDDGHLFSGPGTSKAYGPKFGTGDVIGCGFDFRTMSAFYTKNGVYLGTAFRNVTGRSIFPFVGFKTPGERLRANFGQQDFTFDIAQYYKDERRYTLNKVLEKQQSLLHHHHNRQQQLLKRKKRQESHGEKQMHDQVVLDYLLHHGYTQSATVLRHLIAPSTTLSGISSADSVSQEQHHQRRQCEQDEESEAKSRRDIRMAIMREDVQVAISLCHEKHPGVLDKNPDLLFRLRCRQFIDMVRKAHQQNATEEDPMEVDDINNNPAVRQHAGTKRRRRDSSSSSSNHHHVVSDHIQQQQLLQQKEMDDDDDRGSAYQDDDDEDASFEDNAFQEIMNYGQKLQREYGVMAEQRPDIKSELMVG